MGETNALADRARTPLTRAVLARASEIYQEQFAEADGRVRATFEIITMTGWAPHPDQQKPLKPGSAKARLADALGTVERSATARSRVRGIWLRQVKIRRAVNGNLALGDG